MKHLLLLLAAALLCLFAGCELLTTKPAERATFSTPQTGSNIPRKVAARSGSQQQQQARRTAQTTRNRAAEQQKRESKKRQRSQTVDDDFVPRGGFR